MKYLCVFLIALLSLSCCNRLVRRSSTTPLLLEWSVGVMKGLTGKNFDPAKLNTELRESIPASLKSNNDDLFSPLLSYIRSNRKEFDKLYGSRFKFALKVKNFYYNVPSIFKKICRIPDFSHKGLTSKVSPSDKDFLVNILHGVRSISDSHAQTIRNKVKKIGLPKLLAAKLKALLGVQIRPYAVGNRQIILDIMTDKLVSETNKLLDHLKVARDFSGVTLNIVNYLKLQPVIKRLKWFGFARLILNLHCSSLTDYRTFLEKLSLAAKTNEKQEQLLLAGEAVGHLVKAVGNVHK